MLTRMKRIVLVLLTAALAWAADISGSWKFTVETDAGSGNPSFTFKQDGEKLTGTYKGLFGEAKVAGTVKGSAVEFSFEAQGSGKVTYKGTVDGANKMSGTVTLADVGSGKWTATKD
jgi:hypothetical protein